MKTAWVCCGLLTLVGCGGGESGAGEPSSSMGGASATGEGTSTITAGVTTTQGASTTQGATTSQGTTSSSDASGGSGGSGASTSSTGNETTGDAGTTSSGGSGSATTGASSSNTDGSTTGGGCDDQCPAPAGYVAYECKLRFMYGVNYAWNVFAGDFGGIAEWEQPGVSGDRAKVSQDFADMAEHGVSVVRWWVWPDFRGDGVSFSGNSATGLGGTTQADIAAALEIAEEHDVYLMLTLFSFDNFRNDNGPNLANVVGDNGARTALIDNAVRPFARSVEGHALGRRVVAWDVINEPEWAMHGSNPYGDEAYEPTEGLDSVDHSTMEGFVADVIGALHQESNALTTVGGAALKWAKAWSNVDVDFYQFHIYDWVNDWWPYDLSPADYAVDDKPVVMGEFPVGGLTGVPYASMLESWYENGYAGALGWAVTDGNFGWGSAKTAVRDFAANHACETAY